MNKGSGLFSRETVSVKFSPSPELLDIALLVRSFMFSIVLLPGFKSLKNQKTTMRLLGVGVGRTEVVLRMP